MNHYCAHFRSSVGKLHDIKAQSVLGLITTSSLILPVGLEALNFGVMSGFSLLEPSGIRCLQGWRV